MVIHFDMFALTLAHVGAFHEAPEKEGAKINNPSVTFGASSLYTREPLAGDS